MVAGGERVDAAARILKDRVQPLTVCASTVRQQRIFKDSQSRAAELAADDPQVTAPAASPGAGALLCAAPFRRARGGAGSFFCRGRSNLLWSSRPGSSKWPEGGTSCPPRLVSTLGSRHQTLEETTWVELSVAQETKILARNHKTALRFFSKYRLCFVGVRQYGGRSSATRRYAASSARHD